MIRRDRQSLVLGASALLCLGISGCSNARSEATTTSSNLSPAVVVHTATPAEPEYMASGPIVVENQVDVTAQREGMLASIHADLGQAVHKGEMLASLDDRQQVAERDAQAARMRGIEADLKNWEALAKVADTERDRAEQMWKAQLITAEERDRVAYKSTAAQFEAVRERENLTQSKATLTAMELELGKSKIVAPFDGVVARRYVTAGQRVEKDQKLFWITATAPLHVRFMLPERYLPRVKAGTELRVASAGDVSAAPEFHSARVVRMSPVVDPASGTIEVIAELSGTAGTLKPGMTANIKLAGDK
jgi:membrane fusion protein (multidrug efflux system)